MDKLIASELSLTFDGKSTAPVWARDGRSITYQVQIPGGGEAFRQRLADGSQAETSLVEFGEARARAPVAWMGDGSLLFWEDGGVGSAGNLLFLPPGSKEPQPFASTSAVEAQASVSPDGRYVVYFVNDNLTSVFVQPFPPTGAKWLIAENANVPVW